MKKIILVMVLLYTTNMFSKSLECRPYNNVKVGMYLDMHDNYMIDSEKNKYNKISSEDGLDIYRGYDKRFAKYFVWMIKKSGDYNGVTTFDALMMDDTDNGSKTQLICYDADEVRRYRLSK